MIDFCTYQKKLLRAKQPSSLNEVSDSLRDLDDYVTANLPTYLYRFRSCNEKSFDAFWKDELWTSPAKYMNDDFEARIFYDESAVYDSMRHLHQDSAFIDSIKKRIKNAQIVIPNHLREIPIDFFIKTAIDFVAENRPQNHEYIGQLLRGTIKFCCFSERIDSDLMWGLYAQNATGFALSYHFEKNRFTVPLSRVDNCVGIVDLFPILYNSHRLDATKFMTSLMSFKYLDDIFRLYEINATLDQKISLLPEKDTFMYEKISLIKSLEWEPEKEWRLFSTADSVETTLEDNIVLKVKPSHLFLGRKISKINEKILTEMAIQKGIPVFKMDIDHQSERYCLKYTQLV